MTLITTTTFRHALVGQAEYPNSPFEIVDASVRRHLQGDWKKQVRNRIRSADLVIVMCGEHTHEAEGVATEVKIAQEEDKPYFLLRGHSDRVCTKPTTARSDDEIHEWTWDNLRKRIEGQTLTETLVPLALGGIVAIGIALCIRKARESMAQPQQHLGLLGVGQHFRYARLRQDVKRHDLWI